jgi:PncC family amidohydrolase
MNHANITQQKLAKELHTAFIACGKTLGLAESCTGGALAASITAIAGASKFFAGSLVVYSNEWKESFLGVSQETIRTHESASLAVVMEMVEGVFERTNVDLVAAVSGNIGNSSGSVFVAIGLRGELIDAGVLHDVPLDRKDAIDFVVTTILAALLKRLVHNKKTFVS